MEWVILSVVGAFGQALGWALKKRALAASRMNNLTGLVAYSVASFVFLAWYLISSETAATTAIFWWASMGIVITNVLAAWTAFRALDLADYSGLMPLMAVTALLIPGIEYVLRGELPTIEQYLGMAAIVAGTIVMAGRKTPVSGRALLYFGTTVVCYSIASPLMGITVAESGSAFYSAFISHSGMAVGFAVLVLISKEHLHLSGASAHSLIRAFWIMVLAGLIIGLLENGPISLALKDASASEVFALKRTMPFFALVLGVYFFREHITKRHVYGTILLVVGSYIVMKYQ